MLENIFILREKFSKDMHSFNYLSRTTNVVAALLFEYVPVHRAILRKQSRIGAFDLLSQLVRLVIIITS